MQSMAYYATREVYLLTYFFIDDKRRNPIPRNDNTGFTEDLLLWHNLTDSVKIKSRLSPFLLRKQVVE
jgi:hypothetical protein